MQCRTQEQIEIAKLETETLPTPHEKWQLHDNASEREVLVVHMWPRADWDDKQTVLAENRGAQAIALFQNKMDEANKRFEESKKESQQSLHKSK